jgi:hypothetical protein
MGSGHNAKDGPRIIVDSLNQKERKTQTPQVVEERWGKVGAAEIENHLFLAPEGSQTLQLRKVGRRA